MPVSAGHADQKSGQSQTRIGIRKLGGFGLGQPLEEICKHTFHIVQLFGFANGLTNAKHVTKAKIVQRQTLGVSVHYDQTRNITQSVPAFEPDAILP